MGLKRTLLRTRVSDLCLIFFSLTFVGCLIFINIFLSTRNFPKSSNINQPVDPQESIVEAVAVEADIGSRRVRRAASTWSIPSDPFPVSLGVPFGGCSSPDILSTTFPNATCFGQCNTDSCSSNLVSNMRDGSEQLVCTARIFLLGFKRTGSYDVSRWLQLHPDVQTVMGDMFLTSSGGLNFEDCPNIQLADSTTEFYSNSYSADSIASGAQQRHFYTHCEHCLTTAFTDRYFGTLFLDLPTAMFQYIETNEQKFIITMKNPTDRVISEYFYPFIQKGADLSAVGGDVMHSAMSDAIDEAKQCMTDNGPTLCVYGEVAPSLSETTALYESCYYTYLEHITQQIPLSKIYFVKIEEFHASPESQIALLNKFVGLSATSRSPGRKVGHVHKPFLSETVTMLDAFFAPFNSKLSSLLSDSKWLYQRT